MGFNNSNDYLNYLSEIYSLTNRIKTKYDLTLLSNEELSEKINLAIHYYITLQGSGASSCAESYAFCVASVTASAISGHLGCATADLFPAVGILCHASIIALQIVGNNECTSSYNDCINAQSSSSNGGDNSYWYQRDSYILELF